MTARTNSTTASRATFWTAFALGVGPGLVLYGQFRGMSEAVGITVNGTMIGLVAGVGFPLVVLGGPMLLPKLWERHWPSELLVSALTVGLFAGSVVAETWMLVDEARFAAEVERNGPDQPYDRARRWIHGNFALVYIPREGTHATD